MTKTEIELKDLKESLIDTQPIGSIVKCSKTLDQVNGIYPKEFVCILIRNTVHREIFEVQNFQE